MPRLESLLHLVLHMWPWWHLTLGTLQGCEQLTIVVLGRMAVSHHEDCIGPPATFVSSMEVMSITFPMRYFSLMVMRETFVMLSPQLLMIVLSLSFGFKAWDNMAIDSNWQMPDMPMIPAAIGKCARPIWFFGRLIKVSARVTSVLLDGCAYVVWLTEFDVTGGWWVWLTADGFDPIRGSQNLGCISHS